MTTFVRVADLALSAYIGLNPDEFGRRQPLLVCIDLTIAADHDITALAHSVDYCRIVEEAERIADSHTRLIEVFAHTLATRCLALGPVSRAEVIVTKPEALKRGLASVRVCLSAGSD